MKMTFSFIGILLFVTMLISCDLFNKSDEKKTVTIVEIGWANKNIDTGYWNDGNTHSTQLMSFDVSYTESDLLATDFDKLIIQNVDADIKWTITISEDDVYVDDKYLHVSLSTTAFSPNGSIFPIGNYLFTVTLKNGNASNYSFLVPKAGSLINDNMNFIFNEDYTGYIGTNFCPALMRPIITSATKSITNIQIQFSSNDSLLFSGWVWFYDQNKVNIGKSNRFVTYGTGIVSSFVNNGNAFYSNGTLNIIDLPASTILFSSNTSTYSDIHYYVLVLTDGKQYLGSTYTYDSQSLSAKTSLVIQ